jgi:uncharacterized integral membrane protein
MLRKIVTTLVMAFLALVLVSFALANRQIVSVSLDPFNQADPAVVLSQPLYFVIFALLTGGVVVGGCAAWVRQGRWRTRARRAEAEVARLRAQLNERTGAVPPPAETLRLMVPPAA